MDYRQYDNALGRFHSIDVLSELAPGITPYRFGFNNPVYWSDPTGLFEGDPPVNEDNPTDLEVVVIIHNPKKPKVKHSTSSYMDSSYGLPQLPTGGITAIFAPVVRGGGGAVGALTPAGLVPLGTASITSPLMMNGL